MTITGSDMMPSHIDDMDDEPPEQIEKDGDALNDEHEQQDRDDRNLRLRDRRNGVILSIGATLDPHSMWDERTPGMLRRQAD
jgi:hypothetical protein